mmetsp:Transcript_105931/g.297864  ORF Transcript_105931/g.297864 Transcript_105931/m.297864 type:complete len:202 (+) Transcript_105931:390-995(+)
MRHWRCSGVSFRKKIGLLAETRITSVCGSKAVGGAWPTSQTHSLSFPNVVGRRVFLTRRISVLSSYSSTISAPSGNVVWIFFTPSALTQSLCGSPGLGCSGGGPPAPPPPPLASRSSCSANPAIGSPASWPLRTRPWTLFGPVTSKSSRPLLDFLEAPPPEWPSGARLGGAKAWSGFAVERVAAAAFGASSSESSMLSNFE